jgi:hypothetical protein
MKNNLSRRHFIQNGIGASLALTSIGNLPDFSSIKPKGMRLGLVTYQWGRDWDLPTLIANCEATGYHGVELRVQHAHKVEKKLKKDSMIVVFNVSVTDLILNIIVPTQ